MAQFVQIVAASGAENLSARTLGRGGTARTVRVPLFLVAVVWLWAYDARRTLLHASEWQLPPITPAEYAETAPPEQVARPSYLDPGTGEAVPQPTYLDPGAQELSLADQVRRLTERIGELETTRVAQQDATRSLIRESFAERGANINDYVVFGGTLETLTFWADDFDNVSHSDIILDTAELDFEITVNPWTVGSFIIEYFDGTDVTFPTSEEDEVFIDRLNVRQAWITVGDPLNYPLFGRVGRGVVPFGISTGDPVADVLTINDPLTVEVFETREDFMMIGFAGPICCPPKPPATPVPAPRVRPLLINPMVRRAATSLVSYCPCEPPLKPPASTWPPITCIPAYSGAIYFYNGDTINRGEDHIEHIGGTLGYFKRGTLPYRYVPWSVDLDVDVNSSVFDSNFLQFEYRSFLNQIGYVPGMAAHAKTTVGPTAWVVEWNGAVTKAEFVDDAGTPISIRPSAWQVAFAYQFDWNPSVEIIGAQGTYFTIGYSESSDLAGVTRILAAAPLTPLRVGNVPERRLSVGMGEWVLPGLRVALEYSHAVDYSLSEGGTGESANGVFMQVTYEW